MYAEDKQKARTEIVCRLLGRVVRRAQNGAGPPLDEVLNDVVYHEKRRLDNEPASRDRDRQLARLKELQRRLPRASETQLRDLVEQRIETYVDEVMGNFNVPMLKATTELVPRGLGLLLNALSPRRLAAAFPRLPSLEKNIIMQGETETLKELAERGTLIVVPTHQSNLDSVVLGYALHLLGLPPFIYGAGLNLFQNPIMGFFLRNLGSYTVDRKKNDRLYKSVLKEYATVSLELGYHNLFFPGGTRSRSGAVEQKLKLGLVGCGLSAYVNNLRAGKSRPRIFIVPMTMSFHLILEAETLIDDHLKEAGRSRYIIQDDEFSRPRRVIQFLSNLISLQSRIYLTVSEPLDPFGNRVLPDGTSVDGRGRPIDISRYTLKDGQPVQDRDRDHQYTRELGVRIAEAYRRDNVVLSTHLVAFAVFEWLRSKNPKTDLFRLLRTGGAEPEVPVHEAQALLVDLIRRVRELAGRGKIRLPDRTWEGTPDEAATKTLERALRFFSTYHSTAVIERRGNRIVPSDLKLCYYYRNRLTGYDLETHSQPVGAGR